MKKPIPGLIDFIPSKSDAVAWAAQHPGTVHAFNYAIQYAVDNGLKQATCSILRSKAKYISALLVDAGYTFKCENAESNKLHFVIFIINTEWW